MDVASVGVTGYVLPMDGFRGFVVVPAVVGGVAVVGKAAGFVMGRLLRMAMARDRHHVNRFGFAEKPDMVDLAARLDIPTLSAAMKAIIEIVLERDENFIGFLSDAAQSDFVVPLQLATKLFTVGDYTPLELVSAASTVRYCAANHMAEFPEGLVDLLLKLPQ